MGGKRHGIGGKSQPGRRAYEQVDARLSNLQDQMNSLRGEINGRFNEINSRFNTLCLLIIGSWVTIIAAVPGTHRSGPGPGGRLRDPKGQASCEQQMRRQYQNPPLREAACEFIFQPGTPWDLANPGLIFSELRDQFPRRIQAPPQPSLSFSVGPPLAAPPPGEIIPMAVQQDLRFWREGDDDGVIIVGAQSTGC